MIDKLYEVKNSLRCPNGLHYASTGKNYRYTWLRDNYHCARVDLKRNPQYYKETYQTTLDYFLKIEEEYQKITWLIRDPHDKSGHRYIHPRFNVDLTEIPGYWGWKQWDAVFMTLKGIVEGERAGIRILRNHKDIEIINDIIEAAYRMECWKDPEAGAWENEEGVRTSTLGIILCSLQDLKDFGFFVPVDFIYKVNNAFIYLFPNETSYRKHDLAQLFLIYPFKAVSNELAEMIIRKVENNLLREHGVIRHDNDWYYNRANAYDMHRFGFPEMYVVGEHRGNEAEWHKGFVYLGLAHYTLGNYAKAKYYLDKSLAGYEDGNMPELVFARTFKPNDNYPLAWTVCAVIELIELLAFGESRS